MSHGFERALVVGKFSPLHRGHEHLLQVARARCRHLFILSWSEPEFARCGRARREAWLKARHPEAEILVLDATALAEGANARGLPRRELPANDAPDAVQRDFVAWLLLDWLQCTVDAVFTSEDYGDGLARALTQRFRDLRPEHGAVVHVCVDRQRLRVPVSGSAVRADLQAMREHVAPDVYADLVPRIGLLGGESSGKTTLARALADALGTVWVPEYGRQRWEELRETLGVDELLAVARRQVSLEQDAAQQARGWLVCDTTPLTTLQYCLHDHGHAPPELHELARRHYELTVICEPDFDFVQDGCRRDDGFRAAQHAWTLARLEEMRVPYLAVQGSVQARVQQVLARLASG
jgi:NadR type nicotinamide-nucleotide adenylyltransferase